MAAERCELTVLNDRNYRNFLENPQVVMMMGRSGGRLCDMFKSELEAIMDRFPDVNFGVAWLNLGFDIAGFRHERQDLFEWYDVPPTTILIQDGEVRGSMGYQLAREAEKRISKAFYPRRGFLSRFSLG